MLKLIKKRLSNFNLIDYIFGLILVAIGLVVVFKFFKKTDYILVDLTNLRSDYTQEIQPEEYWQTGNIKEGDKVYNSFGKEIAQVVRIERRIWSSGRRLDTEMIIKMLTVYDDRQKTFVIDGNPVVVGEKLKLNFGTKSFEGLVKNIYKSEADRFAGYKKAKAEVRVRFRDYEKEHIERLKQFQVTDLTGKVLIKVKELKVYPADIYIQTSSGLKIYTGNDVSKVNAEATIELPDVLCQDEICYYNYYQTFAVGAQFWADNGDTFFGGNTIIIDRKVTYVE